MGSKRYTVTVHVANPGTPMNSDNVPLMNEDGSRATSVPGHMFYTTDDGHHHVQSYGLHRSTTAASLEKVTGRKRITSITRIRDIRARWRYHANNLMF